MKAYIQEACEEIDAAIFSGDDFENPENRAELRDYLARWERGLNSKEES